jgi:hypothetical protein
MSPHLERALIIRRATLRVTLLRDPCLEPLRNRSAAIAAWNNVA